jgi:hypothetical protein
MTVDGGDGFVHRPDLRRGVVWRDGRHEDCPDQRTEDTQAIMSVAHERSVENGTEERYG